MIKFFTSGPWETNYSGTIFGDVDNEIYDGDSPVIATIFQAEPLDDEQLANAKLIASAPELFDALEDALAIIEMYVPESVKNAGVLTKRLDRLNGILVASTEITAI